MQTNMIQCAAYGLSTDRLTPHPFNLCSNAGSTRMSIYQRQPQDMTLSMCTMVRTVLSGTCLVKPLYGLGHRAAAQFQVVGNLLIASAIFTEAHCIHWIKKNLTPYLVIMRKDLIITRKDLVITKKDLVIMRSYFYSNKLKVSRRYLDFKVKDDMRKNNNNKTLFP